MVERTIRIEVAGIVQGVGFRPFVYRLAQRFSLKGFVLNHDHGVTIEVEGNRASIDAFKTALTHESPPAVKISSVDTAVIPSRNFSGFEIRPSVAVPSLAGKTVAVSPDLALCEDCRRELWDPADRRYLYPFINCTNCGPRLTIVKGLPYDRPFTTMSDFKMCVECQAEYDDPNNRRFHAQPNACPNCGPRLSLIVDGRAWDDRAGTAIDEGLARLSAGEIVALKGVGGFHLVCDALNEIAVRRLRDRKQREGKALAVLLPDLATARHYVDLNEQEARELSGPAHPIVLVEKKHGCAVAPSVAPRNRFLGVMLPYSPLHELLAKGLRRPLVLTSGNRGDEPIAFRDQDAFERLSDIADAFLIHDRAIHLRCDDTVLRVTNGKRHFYRRSRGIVPRLVRIDRGEDSQGPKDSSLAPILGVGAQLKSTICLTQGNDAIVSHHIGDLGNRATLLAFENAIEHYEGLFNIMPAFVAHDLHPGYLSTKWAQEHFADQVLIGVQHHHAHIAGCLAENRFTRKALGIALDGTGLGTDGTVWGGEFILADQREMRRVGRLRTAFVAGGEGAIRHPWRVAVSYAVSAGLSQNDVRGLAGFSAIDPRDFSTVWRLAERKLNAYETSSCGRLFDAVSAIAAACSSAGYEGQAAIELESATQLAARSSLGGIRSCGGTRSIDQFYVFKVTEDRAHEEPFFELDWRGAIAGAVADARDGRDAGVIGLRFHDGLINGITELATQAARRYHVDTIALSGGCFLNEYLLGNVEKGLLARGFEVLTHQELPCNDGGIAFGQVAVARQLVKERP